MALKTYLGFAFIFYFSHVLSSVLGVFIADRLNIGELFFELKSDIKKMAVCSFLALIVPLIVLYHVQHAGVIIFYVITFFIVTKVAYLGISLPELGIIVMVNLLGMGIFRVVVANTFLLIFYVLFLLVLILIYIFRVRAEKKVRENQLVFEKKRAEEITRVVKENPDFQTFCYECKHYNHTGRECSLDLFNRKKEIKLVTKEILCTYCLYWEQDLLKKNSHT